MQKYDVICVTDFALKRFMVAGTVDILHADYFYISCTLFVIYSALICNSKTLEQSQLCHMQIYDRNLWNIFVTFFSIAFARKKQKQKQKNVIIFTSLCQLICFANIALSEIKP